MKETNLVLASIGTALGATLCCVGPLAAVVTGVGSLAAVSVFEPARPYLLGLTLVLFGLTVYARRKQAAECAEEGTCGPSLRRSRSLWVIGVLLIVLLAFPYYIEPLSRGVLGLF